MLIFNVIIHKPRSAVPVESRFLKMSWKYNNTPLHLLCYLGTPSLPLLFPGGPKMSLEAEGLSWLPQMYIIFSVTTKANDFQTKS